MIKICLRFLGNLFVIDQNTKQVSHTKLWSNVGYLIMCIAFLHQVWDSSVTTELYLVFGALVIGNRTLNKYISKGTKNVSEEPPKEN